MRVKVPSNIAGGSLMGAHNFVKSALARTNPGGSTTNYKIQATDGTPITLSDLTMRKYDEVLIISGARKNPGHKQTTYPVVDPDFNYVSYESRNILGNDLVKLLPKDIDGGMLERLSSEVGTFSALNTITRLMYTNEVESATDPQIAAMLQTYANATRQLTPKSNPGRPFFATDLNDNYRGILSPEEATKAFAREELNLAFPQDTPDAAQAIDRARVVRMYGLNDRDVLRFVNQVLTPYLAVSKSNAGMLKALRSEDVRSRLESAIIGGRRNLQGLDSIYDHQMFRKLVALTPTKAEQFYDGIDYALVAHPAMSRPSLAKAAISNRVVPELVRLVREFPDNAGDALSPNQIGGAPGTRLSFREYVARFFNPANEIVYNMAVAQSDILEATSPAETVRAMRALYDSETRDADIAQHMQNMNFNQTVSFVRDVGGFRPTAPPYWPKPVVLALMETVKDNWNVVSEGTDFSTTFLGLDYRRRDVEDDATATISTVNDAGRRITKYLSVRDIDALVERMRQIDAEERGELLSDMVSENSTIFGNTLGNNTIRETEDLVVARRAEVRRDGRYRRSIETPGNLAIIAFVMSAQMNDDNYFSSDRIPGENPSSEQIQAHYAELFEEIIVTLDQIAYGAGRAATATADEQPRVISILSLFMEIEDRARNRFNYSMTENDRAFVLYLLEMTMTQLRESTEGDVGRIGDGEDRNSEQLLRIIEGYAARGDSNIGEQELSNRMQFEAYVRGIEELWFDAIDMGDVPTDLEITEFFDEIRNDDDLNLPPFALARLDQAADRVRAHYPPIPGDA